MFLDYAEHQDNFIVLSSDSYKGQDESVQFHFKTVDELNKKEKKIVAEIENKPNITNEDLAKNLDIPLEDVIALVAGLVTANIIVATIIKGKTVKKIVAAPKPPKKTAIMYSYEKRPIAAGASVMPTTRTFCKMIVNKGGFYSIETIQKLRVVLGYDVFTRAGGFWYHNGAADVQCRHEWRTNIVIKK